MIIGRVDDLNDSKIFGWAFNTENPDEHLLVKISLGKQMLASSVANVFRPDLPEAGVGAGDHAFEISVPPAVASLHGISIVAQSASEGEILLPIASREDRHLDDLFEIFSTRYEEALDEFKDRLDSLEARIAVSSDVNALPAQQEERLAAIESRFDAAEVSLLRIDETLRRLVEEQRKGKRKRLFGIF